MSEYRLYSMASTISIVVALFFFFIDPSHCLGFTTRLIHRDSPLSPFYNPNATIADRAKAAISRSDARIRYFQSLQLVNGSLRSMTGKLSPGGGEYLMKFSVGTPPQEMMGIIDTGSDLPWFQCLPCLNCYITILAPLDPKKSQTYRRVGCSERVCVDVGTDCDEGDTYCLFQMRYVDGSISSGDLAKDTFVFDSLNVDGIVFGCGHNNSISAADEETGVIGLNREPYSLVSQMNATKFSYCLGPLDNPEGSYLTIGSDAIILGVTTPLLTVGQKQIFYYVNLEGISVGDVLIPIPNDTIRPTPGGQGGVIIDSGAKMTYMPQITIDGVVAEIRKQTSYWSCYETADPHGEFQLCYTCPFTDLVQVTPIVVFNFTGAGVILTKQGSFYQVSDKVWCLAMLPAKGAHSVIGNHAMQGYNVGYEVVAAKVSFSEVDDCSALF